MNVHSFGDPGPSRYGHDGTISPSVQAHHAQFDGSLQGIMVDPNMSTHMPLISPNTHGQMITLSHSPAVITHHAPGPEHLQYQTPLQMQHPGRPGSQQAAHFPSYAVHGLQRHPSAQATRSGSPHVIGNDVFGSPMAQAASITDPHMSLGDATMSGQAHMNSAYGSYGLLEPTYSEMPQGISPARALGPAPPHAQPFTTPNSNDSHTTPTNNINGYRPSMLSSSTSSLGDSSIERPVRHVAMVETSDDENDSPTKRLRDRIPTFDTSGQMDSRMMPPKKITALTGRPPRSQPGPGGRSSAKFAKVAEDPGVEGIPPGPRSTERPSQSFACIIGQAILKSSAGGLSLEHIYRYVETAYPYFKTVDQWRNSVRHNLSIHKIFVTIPRTEKYPPGKGGIWIIDEHEKIHWPSEDKFIKNFPPSHPHHAVCRQTLHERTQEKRAREKAAAEGREYVPKKKSRRHLVSKDDDIHKSTDLNLPGPSPLGQHRSLLVPHPMPISVPQVPPQIAQPPPRMLPPPPPAPPPPPPSSPPIDPNLPPSSFDFEDEGDLIPGELVEAEGSHSLPSFDNALEPKANPHQAPTVNAPMPFNSEGSGSLLDRHRTSNHKRSHSDEDEENFFSSGGPKRVRLAKPDPLSPIDEQHPVESSFLHDDPDMFTTPSRDRPKPNLSHSISTHVSSSALKTPALVQTSSSPTSSPMPPTLPRTSHHPSSLQQAWTHDDMVKLNSPAKLDAAFDLKPSNSVRTDAIIRDDDGFHSLLPHVERALPKTPVSRSSAAADRTPRIGGLRTPGMLTKTPLTYGGSPARAPPSASALLSTPMWEISGVLDRMTAADSPTRTPRSPVPPTSPTHYSLSDCGDSPVAKRRKVAV